MAAPYVSGVVALMLSANPHLTESQVREIITSTSANSTNTSQPITPPTQPITPAQPGLAIPSLLPALSSFLPLDLINIIPIGAQLPFSLQSQALTSTPVLPVVVSFSMSENHLRLRFSDAATLTVQQSNYYSPSLTQPFTQFTLNFYDNTPSGNPEDILDNQYNNDDYWQ